MTIVTPPPEISRDRYGRPLVKPANGGKPVAYTRCTTFIDVLEDKFNLQKWMQRNVALGLASRPDLLLSVSAHREDKKALDRICDDAREAASASAAATKGTALHALTELVDRGQDLPPLPANAQASLDAYVEATKALKAVHIEEFCVQDHLKIGGTPDRIVTFEGNTYIADIKTGSIEWGALKIAMQLSIYSRSVLYDVATGARTPHGADVNRGLIIHLPAVDDPAEATCTLHWIDLEAGNDAVNVAKQVRDQRTRKFKDLCVPFEGTTPAVPKIRKEREAAATEAKRAQLLLAELERRIKASNTADQVRELWAEHEAVWTDQLTEVAKAHLAVLPTAS